MYNKAKRSLSMIATIIGLIFAVGAVVQVAVAIMGLLAKPAEFLVGDSLSTVLKNQKLFESDLIRWALEILIFLLDYLFVLIIFGLFKKPMFINGKYKSYGWKKFFFIILILLFSVIIACQFDNKGIVKYFGATKGEGKIGDMLIALIIVGVAVLACLLQLISMFLRAIRKVRVKKEKKVVKTEVVQVPVATAETNAVVPVVAENNLVNNLEGVNHIAVFKSIPTDPVADGLEQRLREVKHLREAGLINDAQTKGAVEKILYGFSSKQ